MNRRTYIYAALPLFLLLGSGDLLVNKAGEVAALCIAILLILLAWGLVWVRLYQTKRLRPEAAVLTILPQGAYFTACYGQSQLFTSPTWQNLYALSWLAFAAVIIMSLLPSTADRSAKKPSHDGVFILMTIVTLGYTFTTMATYLTTLIERSNAIMP